MYMTIGDFSYSDPESGVKRVEICLGRNTRDCAIFDWFKYTYTPNITHVYTIPDGEPAWVRIRITNNGKCTSK